MFHKKRTDQLEAIAHQGSGLARIAHLAAMLLIVLFSAGSLTALGGDALTTILASPDHLNLPALISVGVSTLLVAAMDVGMLYAASMLRLLATRRGSWKEKLVHQAVIAVVSILEAATYTTMAWRYETPTDPVTWGLVIARALAAPLLSVYLSMARPLPVTARDVMHQVELAAGQGLVRDTVAIASNSDAALSTKAALFGASAVMQAEDRTRLDALIAVAGTAQESLPDQEPPSPPRSESTARIVRLPTVRKPPSAETRIRKLHAKHPRASQSEIATLAKVSKSTVAKYWTEEASDEAV